MKSEFTGSVRQFANWCRSHDIDVSKVKLKIEADDHDTVQKMTDLLRAELESDAAPIPLPPGLPGALSHLEFEMVVR